MPNKDSSPLLKCPACGQQQSRAVLQEKLYICPSCNHYFSMPSPARIATLADAGTFRELDRKLVSVDPLEFADLKSYRDRLEEARRQTGVREAVTTGLCRIAGQPAVLIVFDFEFLGGTMGSVVGEKIANAFEEATERRIPVVSIAASGGARVQEGMLSLMQMAKVSAAVSLHDRERLAFISVLTDPTFGGVTASFASLGDVILAEPGAQIGFRRPARHRADHRCRSAQGFAPRRNPSVRRADRFGCETRESASRGRPSDQSPAKAEVRARREGSSTGGTCRRAVARLAASHAGASSGAPLRPLLHRAHDQPLS